MKYITIAAVMLMSSFYAYSVELTLKMEEVSDLDIAEAIESNPTPGQDIWLDNIGRWTTICPRDSIKECTHKVWEDKYNKQLNTGYAVSNSCGSQDCVVHVITHGLK